MINLKNYQSNSILPEADSLLSRPVNHVLFNHYTSKKTLPDLISSNFHRNDFFQQLPSRKPDHYYTFNWRTLKRVSRNRVNVIEDQLYKGINQLNVTTAIPEENKRTLFAPSSIILKNNTTTKHDISSTESYAHSFSQQNILSYKKQTNQPFDHKKTALESLKTKKPSFDSNLPDKGKSLNSTMPLMVFKMIGKNTSSTLDKELIERKTENDTYSEASSAIEDIFASSNFSSKTLEELDMPNIITPALNVTIPDLKFAFEETNELPSPSNSLDHGRNTYHSDVMQSNKNSTILSINRLHNAVIELNLNKTDNPKEIGKNKVQSNNNLINAEQIISLKNDYKLPDDIPDYEYFSDKNRMDVSSETIDAPSQNDSSSSKSELKEGLNWMDFNTDEDSKLSRIISSLDILMDIIDNQNFPKSKSKLQTRIQTTRVGDIIVQDYSASKKDDLIDDIYYNEFETTLPSSIPPHLVPLGPDGNPLFDFLDKDNEPKRRKQNITERFPFLTQVSTTTRPRTLTASNARNPSMQSLIGRVLDRMTEDPDMRDTMMNGMLSVAPIAMLAIMSSVDLPALLFAPFAAVLPTFLFGSMGDSHLSVSPSSGIQGSHNLNLTIGGMASDQMGMSIPQPPDIVSNDPLADEMAETLYPHLHSLIEFFLG